MPPSYDPVALSADALARFVPALGFSRACDAIPRQDSAALALKSKMFAGQFMASRAMGLASVHRDEVPASQRVRSVGYRFKMAWVYARAIAAEMVDVHPCWNRPDKKLIRYAVCHAPSGPRVALFAERSWPHPAFVLAGAAGCEPHRKEIRSSHE